VSLPAAAIVAGLLLLPMAGTGQEPGVADSVAPPDLEVFVAEGCPSCAQAEAYLEGLQLRRPDLRVVVRDVTEDPQALERLRALSAERELGAVSVPTFHADGRLLVGFGGPRVSGPLIEALVEPESGEDREAEDGPEPEEDTEAQDGAGPEEETEAGSGPEVLEEVGAGDETVLLPLVGRVRVSDLGLPLFTAVIGLVDGFNPCAMWVLLFVLSLLVNVRSRRRMAAIGGTFVLVSGIVYFAFMAAWLNVFLLFGVSRWIQVTLGLVGLGFGAINIKDFFAFGEGPSLGIPERAKPGLYAHVRRILTAENLRGAMVGVVSLAFLVNAVELLCTAGLPALYTQILTLRGLESWQYYGYLALYNVFYMLDDGLVLAVAIITLSHRRLESREARWLKLLSGAVMAALGTLLIFRPDLLTL
ncbi:MAG: glutaredoxin domain-containing protein, partial [Longimicrobiales bacterium]